MLDDLLLLVADDAPAMRFAIVAMLRRAGASVDQAVSGYEVMQQASHKQYDLVLLDVEMPGMDGLETARRLRQSGFAGPILALCGNASALHEACLQAGMNGVLPKPCPRQMLLEQVRLHCRSEQTRGAPLPSHQFSFPSFLEFCDGDEAFMQRLLAIALEALPAAAHELREASAGADARRMGEQAHRIRPTVEGLGLAALAAQLRHIESLVQAGHCSKAIAALAFHAAAALEAAAQDIRQGSRGKGPIL